MNCVRVHFGHLKGRFTYPDRLRNGYEVAKPQKQQTNSWCSTENSSNNAWNVNVSNGNVNNNNKYNSNVVRPVVAYGYPKEFLESVYLAFFDCSRNKKTSRQYIEYLKIANTDLLALAQELWEGTYAPTVSTCFLVKYPKWREVFAANFRDRIVHHWLILHINPLFEQRFIEQGNVSYNCRKGYGTMRCQDDVAEGIKRVSMNYRHPAWVMRLDLVGFFMSIDKNVMWGLMEPFLQEKYNGRDKEIVLRVAKIIIYHQPESLCMLNTNPKDWEQLPANKSLFRSGPDRGMPIGNLTTQIFANFYMSFFDDYVAQLFLFRNYAYYRFVDDFIIICDDRKFMLSQVEPMKRFLHEKLHLELHHDKQYFQPVTHGTCFIGAILKNGRKYLSNRTVARFKERVHGFNEFIKSKEELSVADCTRIQSVLNSYLGFCKGMSSYNIRKEILLAFEHEFYKYFYIRGPYATVKVKYKYRPLQTSF